MQEEKFIDRVQEVLKWESREKTEKGIAAVLETIGERLEKTERENLAAQLHGQLKQHLHKRQNTELFILEDFYNRVSSRADIGYPEAVELSRGVAKVLWEAVSPGEIEKILSKWPTEFGEVFGTQTPGPLSPG
ncbi:MAG: DUF2267 domain-containing protein [Desulforhopalus sp.]